MNKQDFYIEKKKLFIINDCVCLSNWFFKKDAFIKASKVNSKGEYSLKVENVCFVHFMNNQFFSLMNDNFDCGIYL